MFKNNSWLIIAAIIVGVTLNKVNTDAKIQLNEDQYLKIKAELAHTLVEQTTFKPVDPIPQPVIPNNEVPELADCPLCKGSKIITHADGHKTPCPYHGEQLQNAIMELSAKIAEKEQELITVMAGVRANRAKLDLIDKNHKVERQPIINTIKAVTPPYPIIQNGVIGSIECTDGSCQFVPRTRLNNRPFRRIRGWR
jgi:hypothetical protein